MRAIIFLLAMALSQFSLAQAYIEVTGQASLKIPADYVQLSIGLDSRHSSAARAAKDNAVKMARLVNFLLKQGVDKADMHTQQLNLQAQYDYNRQQVSGYTASRTMLVKVRQLDGIDQLLVDLAELGGNRLHGYQAGIDEPQQWQHKLLALASDNARSKALILANSQQAQLGQALQISEGSRSMPQPRVEMARMAVAADAIPASTQVGDINLQSSVRIRFALQID